MKITIAILVLFSFSGCTKTITKTVYIKSKCPKCRVFNDVNMTIPSFKLLYKRGKKKEFIIENGEFIDYIDFVKNVKSV